MDLSLQLARLHTGGTETVVIDNAFHGCIDSVHQLSPKVLKANNQSEYQAGDLERRRHSMGKITGLVDAAAVCPRPFFFSKAVSQVFVSTL